MKFKFVLLISLLITQYSILTAQGRYSSNAIVKIGNERGEFAPDTAGIRKAFDLAELFKEQRGIIPLVVFAPGSYQLDSTFIKLRDSVDIFFYGKAHFTTEHIKGAFYDNNDTVVTNFFGSPDVTNTTDPDLDIVLDNAGSSVDYPFAGGDSLELQEALDRITELEDSSFQQIIFIDAQTIAFQNASGTNVGAILLDPDWLENDGETIFIKALLPSLTLDDGSTINGRDPDTFLGNISEDESPVLGGYLNLNTFGYKITVDSVSGNVEVGDWVVLSVDSAYWVLTDATTDTQDVTVGLAGIYLGNEEVLRGGEYEVGSGLEVGKAYYLTTTPGVISTIAPDAPGNVQKIVAVAKSATILVLVDRTGVVVL